jgi:hypothetical protein
MKEKKEEKKHKNSDLAVYPSKSECDIRACPPSLLPMAMTVLQGYPNDQ